MLLLSNILFSDGNWGSWLPWSPCTATCHTGDPDTVTRFRDKACGTALGGVQVCPGRGIWREEEVCQGIPICPVGESQTDYGCPKKLLAELLQLKSRKE